MTSVGIILPTINDQSVLSMNSPEFVPDWFLMDQTATKAEYYGFDFLLAGVKMRGWDGPRESWNHTLDSFATIAALAVHTSRSKLYASVATLTTPPPLCAEKAATIQDIARGRFGLNIVTGWEKPEYTQMGIWPGDQHFRTRYDHATEYVQIMTELWTTGRSNFKGEYFQMDDCMLGPVPQHPIELVCAGSSDRGIEFCAEYGDHQFVIGKPLPSELNAQMERLLVATAKTGRDVGVYPLYQVVLRNTTAEAEDAIESWRANQNVEALGTTLGIATTDISADQASTVSTITGADAFMFNLGVIAGDADSVAEQIRALSAVDGVTGLMLQFQDCIVDVDRFGTQVMPLLRL